VSLNRWVFKWHLKVRMFLHSWMSAGRELQVDGAVTEKARWASSVCVQGTTSSGASEERRARGGAWVCTGSLDTNSTHYKIYITIQIWNRNQNCSKMAEIVTELNSVMYTPFSYWILKFLVTKVCLSGTWLRILLNHTIM